MLYTKIKLLGHNLAQAILEFCIPSLCVACGENIEQNGLICHACWQETHVISNPYCQSCGIPQEFELEEEENCLKCQHHKNYFTQARAVYSYSNTIIKLISNFKYNRALNVGNFMASRMQLICADSINKTDVILPVPIHRRRLIKRGYNQAAELAKPIAKASKKLVLLDSLQRVKYSPPQATLNKAQRIENIKDCFAYKEKDKAKIIGKNVLLIDDVLTTGATANECSKVLLAAGATKVYVVVFARTGLSWRAEASDNIQKEV